MSKQYQEDTEARRKYKADLLWLRVLMSKLEYIVTNVHIDPDTAVSNLIYAERMVQTKLVDTLKEQLNFEECQLLDLDSAVRARAEAQERREKG